MKTFLEENNLEMHGTKDKSNIVKRIIRILKDRIYDHMTVFAMYNKNKNEAEMCNSWYLHLIQLRCKQKETKISSCFHMRILKQEKYFSVKVIF